MSLLKEVHLFLTTHSTEYLKEAGLVAIQANSVETYLSSHHFRYLNSSYANATTSRMNKDSLAKLLASTYPYNRHVTYLVFGKTR